MINNAVRYATEKKYWSILFFPWFINVLSAYGIGSALDSIIYGNSWNYYLNKFNSHFVFTPNHCIAGIIPATFIFMVLIFEDFNSQEKTCTDYFLRILFSLVPAFMFFLSSGMQANFDSGKAIWNSFNNTSAIIGILSFIACALIVIKFFDSHPAEQQNIRQQQNLDR